MKLFFSFSARSKSGNGDREATHTRRLRLVPRHSGKDCSLRTKTKNIKKEVPLRGVLDMIPFFKR